MYNPKGIFHITGEPDTGKTIAALGAYHPKNTCYIFDDVKLPPIAIEEFGHFINLVDELGNLKLLEFYQELSKQLESLPQYDCIVFDTWSRYGKAIRYYAKQNPYQFRERETFSKMGAIKGMEEWSETHRIEANVISQLSQKCNALFLVTHIKEKIIAGAKTGSYIPDCGKSFDKVCNMRLWLRHNPNGGVPIALVLKRISKIEIGKNGIKPVNVLPRKITPSNNHLSVWDGINYYWDNPYGNREPNENEIPTPFELSILDGILTDDQKQYWQAELVAKQQQEKEEQEFLSNQYNETKAFVESLIPTPEEGKKLPPAPILASQILPEVQERYPDLTKNDVIEMIGG